MCVLQFHRKFLRNGPQRAKVDEVANVLSGCFCFKICFIKKTIFEWCVYVIIANLFTYFTLTENPNYMCTTQSHMKIWWWFYWNFFCCCRCRVFVRYFLFWAKCQTLFRIWFHTMPAKIQSIYIHMRMRMRILTTLVFFSASLFLFVVRFFWYFLR